MIIDIHSHFNRGTEYDCTETDLHFRNFKFMMDDYENCGIKCGGFSFYSSVLVNKEIYEDNQALFELSQKEKKVYQWVVLDPRQEELFFQIEKMINSNKVLGIKIHSPYHWYDIDTYADRIFSFANDLNCFVLMHPDKIGNMVKYADKYKDMKLIIAHLDSCAHIDAIKESKHGNIFTDTSAGGMVLNNILEYAVQKVGSEKIFFGTDTYASGYQIGRVQYSRLSEKDKENIFYKNAINNFNALNDVYKLQ